jgi:hypothetical protein
MARTFEQGEEVIFEVTFYSDRLKTTPVDPSGVTLEIQKPNGAIVGVSVAPNGARPANIGKFIAQYIVADYGNYDWRWETGNPLFVRQGTIKVNPDVVA